MSKTGENLAAKSTGVIYMAEGLSIIEGYYIVISVFVILILCLYFSQRSLKAIFVISILLGINGFFRSCSTNAQLLSQVEPPIIPMEFSIFLFGVFCIVCSYKYWNYSKKEKRFKIWAAENGEEYSTEKNAREAFQVFERKRVKEIAEANEQNKKIKKTEAWKEKVRVFQSKQPERPD